MVTSVRPRDAATRRGREARPGSGRASRRRHLVPFAFLAPGFVLFLALIIYPMVRAFQMSFYDWTIVAGGVSQFIGWDNYVTAYHDPIFWRALGNSGAYMLFTVPPQIVLGLFVATLLRAKAPGPGAVPGAVLHAGGDQLGGRLPAVPVPVRRQRPGQLRRCRRRT